VKTLTREQLQSRKEKVEAFTRNVLDDSDRADEIADESLEEYAERRKIKIASTHSGGTMPKTRVFNPHRISNSRQQMKATNPQAGRSELLARLRELQQENDKLQDTLDKVADLASAPEDGRDEDPDELVDKLNSIIDEVAALDEQNRDENGTDNGDDDFPEE
jgi:hypothetical protein